MKTLVLLLVLLSTSAWADLLPPVPRFVDWGPNVSPAAGTDKIGATDVSVPPLYDYSNPKMHSCYRWMSENEYRSWLRDGVSFMNVSAMDGSAWLNRGGKKNYGTFCWDTPIGSIMGGPNEEYGNILIRIDFVSDAVLYSRNTKNYVRLFGGPAVRQEEMLGIDSDVFYADYLKKNSLWFHEYVIKEPSAIRGWTANDAALRTELRAEHEAYLNLRVPMEHFHMFYNYCSFHTTTDDNTWIKFQQENHRYTCEIYRETMEEHVDSMEKFWKTEPEAYHPNPAARQPKL